MRKRFSRIVAGIVASSCFIGASAFGDMFAGDLKYTFKDRKNAVYNVKVTAEVGDKVENYSGLIEIMVDSTDGAGQSTLGYGSSVRQRNVTDNPLTDEVGRQGAQIVISQFGQVVQATNISDDSHLPLILGLPFTLVVQPLASDGAKTWSSNQNMSLFTIEKSGGQNWGPPEWRKQKETKVVKPAKESIDYAVTGTDGNLVTISRKLKIVSLEVLDDNTPTLQDTGDGQFVFDTDAGLVKSIDMKQTIVSNSKNSSYRLPFTVHAELLSAEAMAKLETDRAEAKKQNEARMAEIRARQAAEHKYDARGELPEGVTKTEKVGGNGGGEFKKLGVDNQPLLGFTYDMGSWAGNPCLGHMDPIFDRDTVKPGQKYTVLAKPGYAVSGLKFRDVEQWGVQVQFAKLKDDGTLDMKVHYESPWINNLGKGPYKQLAGNGDLVVGTWGRQGLNLDALGLLTKAKTTEPAEAAAATTDTTEKKK